MIALRDVSKTVVSGTEPLTILLKRKLFWAVYALALLIFFLFFYLQYLAVWLPQWAAEKTALAGVGEELLHRPVHS